MSKSEPTTKLLKIADVESQLSSLVDDINGNELRILIARDGVPVAALVSVEDLQQVERADEERERRFAIIDELREAFKDVPSEEIERNVVAIVREIRETDEAKRRVEEKIAAERRPA